METLVQKFGGTSLESYEKMMQVCKIVKETKKRGIDLVLVVSAMGRKGAPYATDTLISLLKKVNEKPSLREMDILMSCGEMISGSILVNMLLANGIDSEFLTGQQAGILTNDNYSDSRIKYINANRIKQSLKENKVVVVAGFQGATYEGEITTLGRGGSDTSAVAIGKALECGVVEIFTDVDGIMTADPRIEPDAKILEFINYEEVFQMADKGAKVIHPRAVELAKSGSIVLNIKNTMNPNYKGTKIGSRDEYMAIECEFEEDENDMKVAVAHKDKIAQVRIKIKEDEFTKILDEIDKRNISIDMINFFIREKSFIIDEANIEKLEEVLNFFNLDYEIVKDCAKVTLIGTKITSVPGIMSKIVRGLSKEGVSLLQTSDSLMTISCLVNKKDMKKAVRSIHKEFYVN